MKRPFCNICNDTFVVFDENKNIKVCQCMQRKRILSAYKDAGIPLMFYSIDLNDFYLKQDAGGYNISPGDEKKKTIARNVISSYIEQLHFMIEGEQFTYNDVSSSTLIIYGGKNSGKSMLAACIAKGAIEQNLLSFFIEWSEIINSCYDYNIDVQAENILNTQKYEDIIGIINEQRLLVIDNVDNTYEKQTDTEKTTPSVRRKLDAMFSKRYKQLIPTVFTTNQTPQALTEDEKYGPVLRAIFKDAIYIQVPSLKQDFKLKQIN